MQLDKKNEGKGSNSGSVALPSGSGGRFGPAPLCHSQNCLDPSTAWGVVLGAGGHEERGGGFPTFSTVLANGCFFVGFLHVKGCRGSGGWVAFLERTGALSKHKKAEGCG